MKPDVVLYEEGLDQIQIRLLSDHYEKLMY